MRTSGIFNTNRKNPICLCLISLLLIAFFNFIFCTSLIACENPLSDSTKKQHDLTLLGFFQQGKVLSTNDFVRGNNLQNIPISRFRALSFQLSRQTTGDKLWEQLYNFPRYGAGVYSAQFIHFPEIGQPVAIYGMLDIPIFRWKSFSLNTGVGLGLTFNWESFGEDKLNIALGAEESTYIDAGTSLEYSFKNGFLIDIGTSFTHFSNGALKKPNFGINTFAPKISLGYSFNRSENAFKYQIVPEYQRQSECSVSFFTGWENILYKGNNVDSITKNKGVYYSTYGLSATFNRQISYKSKFGIGLMFGYMGAANSSITVNNGKLDDNDASFGEGFELSIFPSYELVINRLSLLIQPGFYLYRTKYPGRTPAAYQRLGVKYDVLKDISFGINLRAYNYYISDYIEWTIGYRFRLPSSL